MLDPQTQPGGAAASNSLQAAKTDSQLAVEVMDGVQGVLHKLAVTASQLESAMAQCTRRGRRPTVAEQPSAAQQSELPLQADVRRSDAAACAILEQEAADTAARLRKKQQQPPPRKTSTKQSNSSKQQQNHVEDHPLQSRSSGEMSCPAISQLYAGTFAQTTFADFKAGSMIILSVTSSRIGFGIPLKCPRSR